MEKFKAASAKNTKVLVPAPLRERRDVGCALRQPLRSRCKELWKALDS
jgi:hypothetical protein